MDVLKDKEVKTRKEHTCFGCNRHFPKGTILRAIINVDGGDIYSSYWCGTCTEYWSKHMQYGDDINQGDLYSEDPEAWEEIRNQVEGEKVIN